MFKTRDWFILGPVGVVALILGIWGFSQCVGSDCGCVGADCRQQSLFMTVQKSFDLLVGRGNYSFGKHPWQLVVAQYLMPGVALIAAAKLFLANLKKDMRVAFARSSRDHTIVCGIGDTGRHIVENLQATHERIVAIDAVTDTSNAASCENGGVPVIKGDATDARTLELAGLARAKALVLTSGDDAINLEIAFRASEIADRQRSSGHKLKVLAELRNDWLYRTLIDHRGAVISSPRVEFKPFNAHENAARLLFRSSVFERRRRAISASAPHLVVVGFGRIGHEVVAHAIRTAFALPSERLTVTVVDTKGEAAANEFFAAFPGLADIADIKFIQSALTADAPAHWKQVDDVLAEQSASAIIVCLPDDDQSLFAALGFRERLDELQQLVTSVFVRLRQSRKLGNFTSQLERLGPLRHRLVPFGDLSYLTSSRVLFDDELDVLARAAHTHWLNAVQASGQSRGPAQRPWDQLPETFKHANRHSTDHVMVKLRAAGFHARRSHAPHRIELTDTEIDEFAKMEHWRWSIERRMAGWRFGPQRDYVRRLHPLLVDWSQLDEQSRKENRDVMRNLPAMLTEVGLELQRERIISAVGDAASEASRRIEGFRASHGPERLIVVVDPLDGSSCEVGLKAAGITDVSVWLLLSRRALQEFAHSADPHGSDGLRRVAAVAHDWMTQEEFDHFQSLAPSAG